MPLDYPPRGPFREWLEPQRLQDMDTGLEMIRKHLKPGDRFVLKEYTRNGPRTVLEISKPKDCKSNQGREL